MPSSVRSEIKNRLSRAKVSRGRLSKVRGGQAQLRDYGEAIYELAARVDALVDAVEVVGAHLDEVRASVAASKK